MYTDKKDIVTRESILEEATFRCLTEMYAKAQPPCDFMKEFNEAHEAVKNGEEPKKIYDKHYLSSEMYQSITDKYIEAYGIHQEYNEDCEALVNFFEKPFIRKPKDEYGRDWDTGKSLREIIGDENYDEVLSFIQRSKNFYRFNREESSFRFTLFDMGPNSNKEAVEKYWKEQGINLDIKDYSEDNIYYIVYHNEYPEDE